LRSNLEQFGINLGLAGQKTMAFAVSLEQAAFSFLNDIASRIGGDGKSASRGRGLGGLIGGAVGFATGLGPIGAEIGGFLGTAAGGVIGHWFDKPKKASDTAANSLDTLAKTVDKVTESITNIPPFFKVQSYRFAAAPVTYLPPPTTGTPSTPYTPPPTQPTNPTPTADPNNQNPTSGTPNGSIIIQNAHFPNVTDKTTAQDFMAQMRATALKARNRGGSARFAMVGGSSF
jgi:hypothetical protein